MRSPISFSENDAIRSGYKLGDRSHVAIFTHAKNEGAFDGANHVQGTRIPNNAREPAETYAYNLAQICRILEFLPLLSGAVVATAAFAGLRSGELRGLEWTDYSGDALNVKRSVWRTLVNQPKTRASAKPVPVISTVGRNSGCVSKFHGQSAIGCDVSLGRGPTPGLRQAGSPSASRRRES